MTWGADGFDHRAPPPDGFVRGSAIQTLPQLMTAFVQRRLASQLNPTGRLAVVGQGPDCTTLLVRDYTGCAATLGTPLASLLPYLTTSTHDSYGQPVDGGPSPNDDVRYLSTSGQSDLILGRLSPTARWGYNAPPPGESNCIPVPGLTDIDTCFALISSRYGQYKIPDPNNPGSFLSPTLPDGATFDPVVKKRQLSVAAGSGTRLIVGLDDDGNRYSQVGIDLAALDSPLQSPLTGRPVDMGGSPLDCTDVTTFDSGASLIAGLYRNAGSTSSGLALDGTDGLEIDHGLTKVVAHKPLPLRTCPPLVPKVGKGPVQLGPIAAQPTAANTPTVSTTSGNGIEPDSLKYALSFVDSSGVESNLSPAASLYIDHRDVLNGTNAVHIVVTDAPAGDDIAHQRLYRAQTWTGGKYFLIHEGDATGFTMTDALGRTALMSGSQYLAPKQTVHVATNPRSIREDSNGHFLANVGINTHFQGPGEATQDFPPTPQTALTTDIEVLDAQPPPDPPAPQYGADGLALLPCDAGYVVPAPPAPPVGLQSGEYRYGLIYEVTDNETGGGATKLGRPGGMIDLVLPQHAPPVPGDADYVAPLPGKPSLLPKRNGVDLHIPAVPDALLHSLNKHGDVVVHQYVVRTLNQGGQWYILRSLLVATDGALGTFGGTWTDTAPDEAVAIDANKLADSVPVQTHVKPAKGPHGAWAYGVFTNYSSTDAPMSAVVTSGGQDQNGLSVHLALFGGVLRNTGLSMSGGDDHNGLNVNLAYVGGVNQSGLEENAGDDNNGLRVCIASSAAPTLTRNPITGCLQVVGLTAAPPGSNPGDGSGGTNTGGNGGVPPNTSQPPNGTNPNPSPPTGSPPTGTPNTPTYNCDGNAGAAYGGYSWEQVSVEAVGSIFSGSSAVHQGKGDDDDRIRLLIPPPPGGTHDDGHGHILQRFVMFKISLINDNTGSGPWRYFVGPDYGSGYSFGTAYAGFDWFKGTHESVPTTDRWQFRSQSTTYEMNHGPGTTAWIALWFDCNGNGCAAIGASRDTLYAKPNGGGTAPFSLYNSADSGLWESTNWRIGFGQPGIVNTLILAQYADISDVFVADAFPGNITLINDDTGAVMIAASEGPTAPPGIPTGYVAQYVAGYFAFLASTANICPYTNPDPLVCEWWHAGWVDAYNNNVWAPPAPPMPGGSDSLLGIVSGPAGVPVSVP